MAGATRTRKNPFTAISAHGLIEFGYSSGTTLRLIADLEPLFDDPGLGENAVMAGDWNIGTWWFGRDHKYAQREAAVLGLLTAYGLQDVLLAHADPTRGRLAGCACAYGEDCRHTWTYRRSDRPEVAFQDDYAFATPGLVAAAGVPKGWAWDPALSDHAPLVLDLPG